MAIAQANKTHCPQGHPYDEENTCYSGGRRKCLACSRASWAKRHPKKPKPTREEVLWSKVDRGGPGGCWLWTGSKHSAGYGCYGKPNRLAHRLIYELVVGPIPDGLVIDHLCRVPLCVNPAHLEPVTIAENVLRGESPPARNARKTRERTSA